MIPFLTVLGWYLAIGAAFGIWFALRGAARLDSVAADAGRRFKLMLVPGAAALWPLLLLRVIKPVAQGAERESSHDA